jgi:hypothetical protein
MFDILNWKVCLTFSAPFYDKRKSVVQSDFQKTLKRDLKRNQSILVKLKIYNRWQDFPTVGWNYLMDGNFRIKKTEPRRGL